MKRGLGLLERWTPRPCSKSRLQHRLGEVRGPAAGGALPCPCPCPAPRPEVAWTEHPVGKKWGGG